MLKIKEHSADKVLNVYYNWQFSARTNTATTTIDEIGAIPNLKKSAAPFPWMEEALTGGGNHSRFHIVHIKKYLMCYENLGYLTIISLATSGRTPSQNQICRRAAFRWRAWDLGVWSWRSGDLERWRGGASVRLIKITKTGNSSSSSWISTNVQHSPSSSVGTSFDIQSRNEERIADALNWKHCGPSSGNCKASAKSLLWVWSLYER